MKNFGHILTVIFCLIFLSGCEKHINWNETYDSNNKIPFGTYVLRNEMKKLFPKTVIHDITGSTNDFFVNLAPHLDSASNYIFIYQSFIYDSITKSKMMRYVNEGQHVFLSLDEMPEELLDTLHLTQHEHQYNINNSRLKYSILSEKKFYTFDKNTSNSYFTFDKKDEAILPLGYVYIDNKKEVNYVRVAYGEGYFFLHVNPISFTNYYALKGNNYQYIEKCFQFIDNEEVYWDNKNISSRFFSYNRNKESSESNFTDLKYILSQPALKWALILLILMGFLYLVFNSKRRQQAVKIIRPYQNQNLDFAKTLAVLFVQNHNHKDIIENKINYFLENIRSQYLLDTLNLNQKFIENLVLKSGAREDSVKQLIQKINKIRENHLYSKSDFLTLNSLINHFNSQINK